MENKRETYKNIFYYLSSLLFFTLLYFLASFGFFGSLALMSLYGNTYSGFINLLIKCFNTLFILFIASSLVSFSFLIAESIVKKRDEKERILKEKRDKDIEAKIRELIKEEKWKKK